MYAKFISKTVSKKLMIFKIVNYFYLKKAFLKKTYDSFHFNCDVS